MHPLLRRAAQELDTCGTRWLLLRPDSGLDRSGGDIDLLVHTGDASILRGVLSALGFVRLPAWGYGSDRFFLAYDPPTEHWVWLHVTYDLHFGRYGTLRTDAAAELLERRVCDEYGYIPAPDDRFWALLMHCMVDKSWVKPEHRKTLESLVDRARTGSTLANTFESVAPVGRGADWTCTQVRSGAWETLEQCAREIVPALTPDRGSLARKVAITRIQRLLSRVRDASRRGMCVALMGPDGAGKSTLTRGIEDTFFFPSRSVYMGVGTGRVARIAHLLGAFQARGRPVLGRPPFTYLAYVVTLWFRYGTGLAHRMRGRLVVFDRYSYDAWLPMPHRISWLKTQALRLQARAVPSPDLVVVLDVPGDVMFQRKGEFNPAHLERQRQHLLGLSTRIADLEIVDATRPADVVRRDVVERIWRRYQRRWER